MIFIMLSLYCCHSKLSITVPYYLLFRIIYYSIFSIILYFLFFHIIYYSIFSIVPYYLLFYIISLFTVFIFIPLFPFVSMTLFIFMYFMFMYLSCIIIRMNINCQHILYLINIATSFNQ